MSELEPLRTTPARTAKMMAIMLGICIVGGVIFFVLWDYWISEMAPIVAIMEEQRMAAMEGNMFVQGVFSGVEIPVDLVFVEADNFIDFSFNEVLGEPGANPTIEANVGDKLIINVLHDGVSFHSFGITPQTEGISPLVEGTEIGTATAPLTRGQSGTIEFVPNEPGTYYYICTVAGHREQGMVGEIIVAE